MDNQTIILLIALPLIAFFARDLLDRTRKDQGQQQANINAIEAEVKKLNLGFVRFEEKLEGFVEKLAHINRPQNVSPMAYLRDILQVVESMKALGIVKIGPA